MAQAADVVVGKLQPTEPRVSQVISGCGWSILELGRNIKDDEAQEVVRISTLETIGKVRPGSTTVPSRNAPGFNAVDVLKRVHNMAPDIAQEFGLKDAAKSNTPFRLIKDVRNPETPFHLRKQFLQTETQDSIHGTQPEAYIALSYCWHDPTWYQVEHSHQDYVRAKGFSWPISWWMTKALLSERKSSEEGIWVDQCCMNQANNEEKLRTISSMDAIYRQARLVIVVFEDIVIDETEEASLATLEDLMKLGYTHEARHSKASVNYVALPLIMKILSARWFSRAWCSHEFLVSENHFFLIKLESRNSTSERVIKITVPFLIGLYGLAKGYRTVCHLIDEHHHNVIARFEEKLLPHWLALRYRDKGDDQSPSLPYFRSFMEVFLETSMLGSSVAVDKMVIALNVVGCEVYFQGGHKTELECGLFLSVLALAAGDPTVLCCSGERIRLSTQSDVRSWLRWPRHGDFAGSLNPNSTYRRLDHIPDFTKQDITLDLIFVADDRTVHQASDPFVTQATWFIDGRIQLSQAGILSRELDKNFTSRRDINIKILACALECGFKWIIDGMETKGTRRTPVLRDALETCFSGEATMSSFENLCSTNPGQCGIVIGMLDLFALDYLSSSDPAWTLGWIEIGAGEEDKIMIMCPTHRKFTVTLPALLLNKDFVNCKCVFLLDPVSDKTGNWAVLGETTAFGRDLSALRETGLLREKQLISG